MLQERLTRGRLQQVRQAQQVDRLYPNQAASGAVNVRDQEERNRHDEWQRNQQIVSAPGALRSVTDQPISQAAQ